MLSTGSLLAKSDFTYDLLVELARGTLNRVRNQISIWQEGGLQIGDDVDRLIAQATQLLGSALMAPSSAKRDEQAGRAISHTLEAIFSLSHSFADQVNTYRRSQGAGDGLWLGVSRCVESNEPSASFDVLLQPPFDRLEVSPSELPSLRKDLNNADRARCLIVGPCLDASPGGMSQVLIEADDFRARRLQILNSARETVTNLPIETSLLHVVSGLNGLGHRHLNYSQQLQVTTDLLNVVNEVNPSLPTMIGFDFPWAERLASAVGGIHPLQVADSLLRGGAQVSLIGLEMNLDYGVTGSAFRDPLQWIDLVDLWAQLGVPLVLCLRVPTGVNRESLGTNPGRSVAVPGDGMADQQRFEMLQTVLPMMAARPSVAGVLWPQWADNSDPRFPFGGFVDEGGNTKPVFDFLASLKAKL
jgi:hypothetical protein